MYEDILCTNGQVKPGGRITAVCLGVALAGSEVPTEMVGRCGLRRHRHERQGQPEYRFLWRDRRPRLPVLRDGRLFFARWGNGRGQSRHLPWTGWTWLETVQGGGWRHLDPPPVPVDIPASFGLERRGVWYHIEVGIRGLLVPDERGLAVCYMLCEPASHYYQVMTGSPRMPVLIGQRI
jgi:hypothetical protein